MYIIRYYNRIQIFLVLLLFMLPGCSLGSPKKEPIPLLPRFWLEVTGLADGDEAAFTIKSSDSEARFTSKNGAEPVELIAHSDTWVITVNAEGYQAQPESVQIKFVDNDIYILNEDGTLGSKVDTITFGFTPIDTPIPEYP